MTHTFDRRKFMALGLGGLVVACGGGGDTVTRDSANQPASSATANSPTATPTPSFGRQSIEHIVVVMMENRSFDHLLGWLPGAEGIPAGLTYPDKTGKRIAPARWADYHGCGHPDPDHSVAGGRTEFNSGACDGWLRAGANDPYAISYYTEPDLAFFGPAAREWTVFDHYFSAIMGPTTPNRLFLHSAQTDRADNTPNLVTLPTIWDRLADKGLTARYYVTVNNFLAMWGTRYQRITASLPSFLAACSSGTLPNVAYIDPDYLKNSDHPHQDMRDGEYFLDTIYKAVTQSPAWSSTVLVITFDEWGGFFDHVPPPVGPMTDAMRTAGIADGLRGFRVPTLIISPFARRHHVATGVYDHTSVLKMIEWRWELAPLTERDAAANNLADALDFSRRDLSAPQFNVPEGPNGSPCV